MYIVTRETIDYHNDPRGGLHDNDVVGIFSSRNEANKAAQADLLNEWNMDFFESYEVEEEDGLVTVTAVCPEGEEMTVTVKEAPNKMSLGPKKSSKSGMRKVYYVTRETIDYHNDYNGGIQDTDVVGTFFSRKKPTKLLERTFSTNGTETFLKVTKSRRKMGWSRSRPFAQRVRR